MKAFMTNGTIDFLFKLQAKQKDVVLHLISTSEGAIAYYEDDRKKKIFQSGREYEILIETGDIKEQGFIVMNHIPVSDDSKPVYEHRFKQESNFGTGQEGFQAFRLLRPKKGDTYIALTQWSSRADYKKWKLSEAFKNSFLTKAVKAPANFMERPFTTTGKMYIEED